jgi:hypothetical protein
MRKKSGIARLLKLVWIGLTIAAIRQELKQPPQDREWHGEVAGFVPYDFRLPTADKLRERWWDPEGAVVQPQVFGVGWTLNFGRIATQFKERAA